LPFDFPCLSRTARNFNVASNIPFCQNSYSAE
jgi:hypothetical protein